MFTLHRRTFLKAGAATATGLVAAPWFHPARGFAQDSQDIVFATDEGVDSLDPTFAKRSASKSVANLVMETLVAFADPDDLQIVPRLAESWEIGEDNLTWTFALRQGVEFHDGTPFNAEAAKYSFDRLRDPATGATELGRIELLDRAEVVDEYTLQLITTQPYADFLTNLTDGATAMFSPTWAQSREPGDYGREPVGTGPYRLDAWTGPETVRLVPYDNYWGDAAQASGIVFTQVPDQAALVAGLESGEIHVTMSVPPIEVPRLEADSNFSVTFHTLSSTNTLGLLTTKAPFDNPDVRRALNHAIDKDAITQAIYGGMAVPSTTPLYPGNPYRSEQEPYAYDPDLARQLLTDAGFGDGFEASILFAPISPSSEAVQAIGGFLGDIGVQADLQSREPAVWSELVRAADDERDMFYQGKAGIGTDWNLSRLYSEAYINIDNRGRWVNARVEEVLVEARTTFDDAVRAEHYAEIQQIVWEDAAEVFLWSTVQPLVTTADIGGVTVFPNPLIILDKATRG